MAIIGRRGRPPGSKNKVHTRRKSPSDQKLEEQVSLKFFNLSNRSKDEELEDSAPGIKTKYGRKVHAPQQFQPTQSIYTPLLELLLIEGTSRKRRPDSETNYCHICSRSGSPGNNKLVFCDNCDFAYHQLCHVPSVPESVIASPGKWFCSACKPPQTLETHNQRMMGHGLTQGQVNLSLEKCY
jgi:PHD-finger